MGGRNTREERREGEGLWRGMRSNRKEIKGEMRKRKEWKEGRNRRCLLFITLDPPLAFFPFSPLIPRKALSWTPGGPGREGQEALRTACPSSSRGLQAAGIAGRIWRAPPLGQRSGHLALKTPERETPARVIDRMSFSNPPHNPVWGGYYHPPHFYEETVA